MSDERSNTAPEQRVKPGVPFQKGDKRINRKGRPRTFDALRAEAVKIAGELVSSPDGSVQASRINVILLDWATSKDPRKQALFMEYAYGKVPTKDETKHSGALTINVVRQEGGIANGNANADEATPSTGADQT